MIVQEREVLLNEEGLKFDGAQLKPILNLAISILNNHQVNVLQTYHEIDAPITISQIMKVICQQLVHFVLLETLITKKSRTD
ncbi:hypothetical protein SAMN04487895_1085 [Paenibacillus sophorae]|uniref:Uncharacterized protein n=1 Tax=Paenibacillus sophorae TaxID=1333845 RepID=A0A1H8PZ93_9BACL|nr:hypothetical protein [Paenibacillus sophorae]QWU15331.1 hypothetical protein KP014_26185 [Paenibacillus sophorae]SEO47275.1 hypothetical protein SAMN04487895_1085 [Paenibacillus sophorae]